MECVKPSDILPRTETFIAGLQIPLVMEQGTPLLYSFLRFDTEIWDLKSILICPEW